jgi:hypothetical protein
MINANLYTPKGDYIIIGLTFSDLNRLRSGEGLTIKGEELGYDGKIVIFSSQDNDKLKERLIMEISLYDSKKGPVS